MAYVTVRRKQSIGHMGGVKLEEECAGAWNEADGYWHTQVIGWVPRLDVPSPYSYSPVDRVFEHRRYGAAVIREVAHRRYVLFSVDGPIFAKEEEAMAVYIAGKFTKVA